MPPNTHHFLPFTSGSNGASLEHLVDPNILPLKLIILSQIIEKHIMDRIFKFYIFSLKPFLDIWGLLPLASCCVLVGYETSEKLLLWKLKQPPWLGSSVGWSIVLMPQDIRTKQLIYCSPPVREHARVNLWVHEWVESGSLSLPPSRNRLKFFFSKERKTNLSIPISNNVRGW